LDTSYGDVSALLKGPLSPGLFRETLTKRPDLLDTLSPLVAPIEVLAQPGDLLIFCPSGNLHDVPLHALALCGAPLIARHPVLYAPCLASLAHLQSRETLTDVGKVLVIGDPGEDRPIARMTAQRVAAMFAVEPLLGAAATKAAFFAQAGDSALIHFQGHAAHDPLDPWNASLQFHDGRLTLRELLAGGALSASIIVLGACEARKAAIGSGDEPIGIASGLLAAGARSVLAPAWPVREAAADAFMSAFYAAWTESWTTADAVRTAILEMRQGASFSSMLDWAPYALYGANLTRWPGTD
jgi:CHAT domain-containing protein